MTNVLGRNPFELTLYFLNMRLVMAACWFAGVMDYVLAALNLDGPRQAVDGPKLSLKLSEDHYWIGGAAALAILTPAILF